MTELQTTLQTEIIRLEERRVELIHQSAEQSESVQNAHDNLVNGDGSPRDVSMAQSDLSALGAAISDLNTQIKGKREQLAQAVAEEELALKVARGIVLAQEAQAVFADHQATFQMACEQLLPQVERLLADRNRLGELRAKLNSLGVALPCPRADLEAINIDWRFYKFDHQSPAAKHGVESAFIYLCNQIERREIKIPNALARSSWPLDIQFKPESGPPRGMQSSGVGPTRMDESNIDRNTR